MSKNLLDYVGLGHFLEKIKTLFVTGLGTSGNNLTWTKNGTTNNITIPYASKSSELIPLQTKLYTGVIGTANNNPGAVFYFMSIRPEDWNKPCKVTYRIYAEMDGLTAGKAFSIMSIVFSRNTTAAYDVWNYIGHTDYRPYYYHYRYLATATGYNNNYGHLMGIGLNSSYSPTTATYARNFTVDVLEATDCTVTLFDTMTKYANVPGTGSTNYSGETTYNATAQGETHSGDNNDVNYQNREYYGCRKTNSALYRYTLCLTKSDGSIVPLNSVSNTVATTKELTSDSFDPFGEIFYWNSTTTYSAGANVGDGAWYRQILFDARYSFNTGGYNATGTLVARSPVYLVAVPRSDGTAVLNSTPLALVLPTEDDGLIYIYLGRVYPDSYPYRIALSLNHPVYYYKNGAVRLWSSEQDLIFSASPAAGITSTNITAWNGKQDAISDLATIRSGASAGATAYQKPSGGIPKTDLSSAVQTSLGKADTALQSHQDISGKVDKVTSTDNAVVRFDGTSGAVQNSGVTINDSNQVTAARFITSGGAASQVVLGNGSLAAAKELPQYEAYLEWGGKNFSGAYSPIDAAMVAELGACRTMFLKAAGLVIEYSTDNGTTWNNYEASDSAKIALFSTGLSFYTGANSTAGGGSPNNMLRVTLRTSAAGIYTTLNKFVIFVGTNGSTGCYCTIRCRTLLNYEDAVDTWVTLANLIPILGWTGYNVINISPTTTYGNTKNTQYGEWQFIFGSTGFSGSSTGLYINKIFGFGGMGWVTPSNMAKTGHLYSYDSLQNTTFPAQVTATAFKKVNGTSSQFLKADGSSDSATYTPQTSAGANAILTSLPDWTANPTDTTKLIRRDTGGSASFGQVTFLTLWTYIAGKISSVLGIGGSNGTPTAPTATKGTNTTQVATTAFVQTAIGDKQNTISDLATIRSGASAGATAYQKPSGGIPKTDLASAVQTSLGKADTAVQTETDPTVPSWAKQSSKPTYTAQEVGALPASTSIPSKTSDLTNDSGFLTQHQDISGKENTSNKVTSLSSSSTDTLYPSAKCVYDLTKDNCVFIEGIDTYPDF